VVASGTILVIKNATAPTGTAIDLLSIFQVRLVKNSYDCNCSLDMSPQRI
jgi:hypothetical protein